MNRSLARFLKITIPLGLGIFLIWYIYQSFTPEQLAETKRYFSEADYLFVFLAVIINILSHLARAYRWNYILEPMGYHPRLANNFMAISVAYLLNLLIPRSGEVSRAVILDRYEKVPFQKGFGTIISERVVDLFFLLFFTSLALIVEFNTLYDYIIQSIPSTLFHKLLILGIMGALGILGYILISRSKMNNRIKTFLLGLKEGVFSIIKMKRKGAFIFYSVLIWVLYVLGFYATMLALPQTAVVPFGIVIVAFVTGSFTLTLTNSGFGSYPFAMAGILSIFGIAKTAGVAFGWIVWISSTASNVLIGVLSLILLPWYNKKRQ